MRVSHLRAVPHLCLTVLLAVHMPTYCLNNRVIIQEKKIARLRSIVGNGKIDMTLWGLLVENRREKEGMVWWINNYIGLLLRENKC